MNPSPDCRIIVREADPDDALHIIKIHFDAVHITAAKDYDEATLTEWSNNDFDRRTEQLQNDMNQDEGTIKLMAEVNGSLVGFGEIAPRNNEIKAVYVSPAAGRMGVGTALLTRLEELAKNQGCKELWLHSSLTAQAFYLSHGYQNKGTGEHQLRSGRKMACIYMRKTLTV